MHYVRERDRSIRTRGRHVLPTLDRHPCAHQTHTSVASPTNGPPAYSRFRYRLLLSFPQAVLIRQPGGLGVVWEIDRDALPASRFGDCVCAAGDVLFVVAKRAKRWRLPACFTGGVQKQYAPVQAMRPQTARGGQCASFVTGAGRGIGYTFSSALDTGDGDHDGTAQQGWLAHRPFFPAVRPSRLLRCAQPRRQVIRALQHRFSALAWTRTSKHVTITTAVTQLPTAHQRRTQSHYSENRLRETAPFSIFPARAELLAVRSLLAQPDLLRAGDPPLPIGDGVIASRSTAHHTGSSRCAAGTHM